MPKLLIVDDEEATLDMLSTYLSLIGHQTVSAVNGQDGLHKAQAEKPDLMLLDLMMPDVQGYEVCAKLRTQSDYSALPILIISARTDQGSIDKAMSSGADGYFTKPLDLPSLTQEIERLLANPPQHTIEKNGSDNKPAEAGQTIGEDKKEAAKPSVPSSTSSTSVPDQPLATSQSDDNSADKSSAKAPDNPLSDKKPKE